MKYALHARCEKQFLKQADEIIVSYREKDRLLDYPNDYPEVAVTIQCYETDPDAIDYKWLAVMASAFPKGYSVGFLTWDCYNVARELKINSYLLRHICTYAELNELKRTGACYVYLMQPLFSSIDKVKNFEIPVRQTPNLVNSSNINLQNLAHGSWIRPEDLYRYEVIPGSIAEFPGAKDYKAEQAFFKVYKKAVWPQDLGNLLIELKGLNINNYLLQTDPEFGERRLNCHQKCEESPNGMCHYCDTYFKLANPNNLKKIKELQN